METTDKQQANAAKKAARARKQEERRARAEERLAKLNARMEEMKLEARFEGWKLSNGHLSKGFTIHNVAGAVAEFQHGANIEGRVTLTRVALVGIFALGIKKDRKKVYIAIEFPDGQQELIEAKAKDEKDARKFAAAINAASRHYANKNT